MTAEIAIMNSAAIALAADSASTVQKRNSQVIYNSANKLFALSKYQPVGIMIYQDAEIMRLPWETAIKIYRRRLGKTAFKYLNDYAKDFFLFLEQDFFTTDDQQQNFERAVTQEFQMLRYFAENIEKEPSPVDAKIKKIIQERRKKLAECPMLDPFKTKLVDILGKNKEIVKAIYEKVFHGIKLSNQSVASLMDISHEIFTKDDFVDRTGVVFAGFGENERFPSFIESNVGGVVLNTLKYKIVNEHSVEKSGPCIAPFAQKVEVDAFMRGNHPDFRKFLLRTLSGTLLKQYPLKISQKVAKTNEERVQIEKLLVSVGVGVMQEFNDSFEKYQRENHVQPIVNTIRVLPKDELALMAEALVNLTSFKKKVTMDSPTVGGPIDVAVISKGDGFVWIKRKHYFRPELNHHFLHNYFPEGIVADGKGGGPS